MIVAGIGCLCGCATGGRETLSTRLDKIQPRMDTETVVRQLGEPGEKFNSGAGSEVWIYRDSTWSAKKRSLIPVEYLIYIDEGQVTSYEYLSTDI